ncbi:MAG: YjjG family noncanonical pyrimidine nucleotidase [Acidimicrobiia bacterium]|nr:YjjG family noncanonical pyrimidine nucleotidase [Acidimicrobiia bacterium]
MPYSTVLFDLDHTLLDSDESEAAAFAHTMRFAGVADHEPLFDAYRRINLAMWAQVEAGTLMADDVRTKRFEAFNELSGIEADPGAMGEVFVEGLGSFGQLYPGAIEMLEAVGAIAVLGLVTNGISDVQRARVARLGIERFFDAIVISSEVATSKPGGAIFDIAFERLGRPARSATVMVGDSLTSDMAGGHRYGIATCWYNPRGEHPAVDFELDHVVAELGDVVDVVTR